MEKWWLDNLNFHKKKNILLAYIMVLYISIHQGNGNTVYVMTNKELYGSALPAKNGSLFPSSGFTYSQSWVSLKEGFHHSNVVAWMIWNSTISALPDENHYNASVQSEKGWGGLLYMCLYVCVFYACVCSICVCFFVCLL